MRCDYEQIPAQDPAGRVRGCLPGCSCAPTQVQSQEVYPAPVTGLPGAQGVLETRIPPLRRASHRSPRCCQSNQDGNRAALHHLPEGCPATAPGYAGPPVLRPRARAGDAGRSRKEARPARRCRWLCVGDEAQQPVLRQARSRSGYRDQVTTYAKFPKVVFEVDCTSHMILAAIPGRGPRSDLVQIDASLEQAIRRAQIETLLAHADFDAE